MKAHIFAFVIAVVLSTPVLADEIGGGRCGVKPGDICFSGFATTTAAGDSGDDEIGGGKTRAPASSIAEPVEFSIESFWMFVKLRYKLGF